MDLKKWLMNFEYTVYVSSMNQSINQNGEVELSKNEKIYSL